MYRGRGGGIPVLGPGDEFPDPALAPREGLVAIGGDLSVGRLLSAYRAGIFPWPLEEEAPLLWWSPDPRFVLEMDAFHVSRRLGRRIRSARFDVRFDTAFAEVIAACAESRPDGTWITAAMRDAYVELHRRGFARCAECWREGRLAGGIYGVALGRAFFGESMFHRESDASKVALAALVGRLREERFVLFDCQQETGHMESLGARPIPRARFLRRLREATA